MPDQSHPFLTATWQDPILLTYEIDPELLREYVPQGLSLDYRNSKCLISLVGLHFLNTHVMGLRVPFFGTYSEINLRFYVLRECAGELRRGVVFIKQVVPFRAVALLARVAYHENFAAMPVRYLAETSSKDNLPKNVSYHWKQRGQWNRIEVNPQGPLDLPEQGSVEAFIAERYWGYNSQPDGSTLEYRIERPRWRIRKTSNVSLDCRVTTVYGGKFTEALNAAPVSAFWAEGSTVSVYRGVRI